MKKQPFKRYQKLTGRVPYIGTMAEDSDLRRIEYLKDGCNKYYGIIQSKPLSIWTKADVKEYLKHRNYCSIYDGGYDSTGCMFCMFGIVQESKKGLNRFQKMKITHPKYYNVAMKTFGIGKVLDFIGALAFINKPIKAHFFVYKSGHDFDLIFIKKFLKHIK